MSKTNVGVGAAALKVSTKGKEMTNHKCKVLCQRFGMSALGAQFVQTQGDPTACSKKCDEVYKDTALIQLKAMSKTNVGVGAAALKVSTKGKEMTNHKCKVLCQRFGMSALGAQFVQTQGDPTA